MLEDINPPWVLVHVLLVPQEPQAPWLLLLPTTVHAHSVAGKALLEVCVCVLRDITAKVVLNARKILTAWVAQQLFKLHAQTTHSPQPAVTPWMIVCVMWGILAWMPLHVRLVELIHTKI